MRYSQWTESTKDINVTITENSSVVDVTNQSDMVYIMTGISLSDGFGSDAIIESVDEDNQRFTMSDGLHHL